MHKQTADVVWRYPRYPMPTPQTKWPLPVGRHANLVKKTARKKIAANPADAAETHAGQETSTTDTA
jgi:hypothetical protein